MKFANANSFKSKMKDIAKKKGVPAQQVQQQYLLEEILKAIAVSNYKDSFILKGGYLIGQIIGLDKRTTMDLDVTLKGITLNIDTLISVFNEIVLLLNNLAQSNYQENLWSNYQKRFLYAKEISYASTNDCLYELLNRTDI